MPADELLMTPALLRLPTLAPMMIPVAAPAMLPVLVSERSPADQSNGPVQGLEIVRSPPEPQGAAVAPWVKAKPIAKADALPSNSFRVVRFSIPLPMTPTPRRKNSGTGVMDTVPIRKAGTPRGT